MWNAERPRYLDIIFSDRIHPAMRGAGMDCRDFFPVFHLDKDCVGTWLRVAGISSTLRQSPVWMSFQLVLSKAAAMLCTFCTMSPLSFVKEERSGCPLGC